MSKDTKVARIEEALHAGWIKTPKNEIVRTDRWVQLTTRGLKGVLQNGVFRSILEPPEAQAKIEETIAHYRSLGVPFWWVVTPSTKPADMEERLLARGFKRTHTASGMLGDPASIRLAKEEGVGVEPVTERNLDAWLAVLAEGWSTPAAGLEAARAGVKRRAARGDTSRVDLLVRAQGEPVGAGSMSFFKESAHLFGGVVLPRFRGRGFFRTRVAVSLELAAARGLSAVTVHSLQDTAAPILRHFGFEEVCELRYYGYE
jgi:GNAT superfamily N-acetyltransferase